MISNCLILEMGVVSQFDKIRLVVIVIAQALHWPVKTDESTKQVHPSNLFTAEMNVKM